LQILNEDDRITYLKPLYNTTKRFKVMKTVNNEARSLKINFLLYRDNNKGAKYFLQKWC